MRPPELRAWIAGQHATFLQLAASNRLPRLLPGRPTGMRRSEILGLRWGNIDLDAARLSVHRALVSVCSA
jgi:integrase